MSTMDMYDTERDESSGTVPFYLPAMGALSNEPGRVERFVRRFDNGHRL